MNIFVHKLFQEIWIWFRFNAYCLYNPINVCLYSYLLHTHDTYNVKTKEVTLETTVNTNVLYSASNLPCEVRWL